MKFSMTGQEKCDLLIQVTVYYRGNHMGRFDCIYTVIMEDMNYNRIDMLHRLESGENIIGSIYIIIPEVV